ncbi:MAG: hypothetical protein ACOZNI_22360 [Myxococcota bacterium]
MRGLPILLAVLAVAVPTEALARKVPSDIPSSELDPGERHALDRALDAYEDARAMLAREDFRTIEEPARRIALRLDEANEGLGPHHPLKEPISRALAAADRLGSARRLDAAREQFGELSRRLVQVVRAEDRLRAGRALFYCPMVKGYPYWIQTTETLENPYVGPAMKDCGKRAGWDEPDVTTPS